MRRVRILYVEDSDDLREAVTLMLESEQREIVACEDGEQALAAFEAGAFDVLMTDVSLPNLSGTDLARRVLESQPQCWVIFCSGYQLDPELMRLGPNVRALSKPFEFDELDALVSHIAGSLQRA